MATPTLLDLERAQRLATIGPKAQAAFDANFAPSAPLPSPAEVELARNVSAEAQRKQQTAYPAAAPLPEINVPIEAVPPRLDSSAGVLPVSVSPDLVPPPPPAEPPLALPQKTTTPGGAPSPAMYTEDLGLDVEQDEQQGSRSMIDPMMFAPTTSGMDLAAGAIQRGAAAEEAKAKETAAGLELASRREKELLDQAEARRLEREAALRSEETKLQKALEDHAAMKVTSPDIWANKTTGEKIGLAIGLFLGAFGSGGNKAVAAIDEQIRQDMAVQKANIEKAGDRIGALRGVVADMRQRFRDDSLADAAARAAYYDNAINQTKAKAARYDSDIIRSKSDEMIASLEQRKEAALNEFKMKVMEKQGIGGVNDPYAGFTDDQRKRLVLGYGLAATEDDAKEAKKAVIRNKNAGSRLNRLIEIGETSGASLSRELRAEADDIRKELVGMSREAVVGPGAMTDREYDLLLSLVGDPASFTLGNVQLNKLKQFKGRLDQNLRNELNQRGLGGQVRFVEGKS